MHEQKYWSRAQYEPEDSETKAKTSGVIIIISYWKVKDLSHKRRRHNSAPDLLITEYLESDLIFYIFVCLLPTVHKLHDADVSCSKQTLKIINLLEETT